MASFSPTIFYMYKAQKEVDGNKFGSNIATPYCTLLICIDLSILCTNTTPIPTPTPPPIPTPTPPTCIPTPTPPPIPTPTSTPPPILTPTSPPPPPPETEPTTDEHIYEEHSPIPKKLISRIDSLELDLKQTKLTMGNAIVKLVKKVKKLEGFMKKRNLVLTDSEEEEPEAQGRKSR
ncbi:hypothetical protein Tco_1376135 [Tanacetum coccineum]